MKAMEILIPIFSLEQRFSKYSLEPLTVIETLSEGLLIHIIFIMMLDKMLLAYLGDTAGLVPDHYNKSNTVIK